MIPQENGIFPRHAFAEEFADGVADADAGVGDDDDDGDGDDGDDGGDDDDVRESYIAKPKDR